MAPRCQTLLDHTCYEVLPSSFKVIVFDQSLLLKKALSALVQHGVQSAPIWDSKHHKYVGMLTGNLFYFIKLRILFS
jgi:5'-AMP-activated protein kinase regulatory gamma subunit